MKPSNHPYSRYILDPLYGAVYFPDFIWDILFIPEIQRLRELRLYNINSLYFTGGANISRYEHSLGTCYLAIQCVEANHKKLPPKDKMLIILAALLHDLYNGAFGHTLEYVEGFSPENLFSYIPLGKKHDSYKYKHASFEPIFFGMCEEINSILTDKLKLTENDILQIGEYINGEGEFGPLISGSIDLDNIDNIYRMSYHMGLIKKTSMPIKLAKSIFSVDGKLYLKKTAIPQVRKWIKCREVLYNFLLLNPDEFSAKFMLAEAIELSIKNNRKMHTWYSTDFQLLEKLSTSSLDIANIISRLMKGTFYGCLGLYKTTKVDKKNQLFDVSNKRMIEDDINNLIRPEISARIDLLSEKEQKAIQGIKGISYDKKTGHLKLTHKIKKDTIDKLNKSVMKKNKSQIREMYQLVQDKIARFKLKSSSFGIHTITDINKVHRKVTYRLLKNDGKFTIGHTSQNLYIGVFIRNIEFANFNFTDNRVLDPQIAKNIKNEITNYLISYLEDPNLEDLKLYSEVQFVK